MTILTTSGRGTTSAIDTTGMTFIAVYQSYDGSPATLLADSKSNTWTALTLNTESFYAHKSRWFYCENPTVGSGHTFTQAQGYASIFVFATDEAIDPTAFDLEVQALTTGANSTSLTDGPATGSQASTLHIAAFTLYCQSGSATAPTIGTGAGWTQPEALSAAAGSNYGGGLAWQRKTSATSSTATWGWTSTASSAAGATLVIKTTSLGPTITSQPGNQTVTAGNTAAFGVTATSSGGALSYQWQRSTNSGGSWSNVTTGSGGTSASYTTAATTVSGGSANNGDQYRCQVTDSNGTTTSSAASLTVNAAAATGASMTGPSSGVVGAASSNFTLTLTPAGGTSAGVTYTPSSGGGGGTFSPTSVTLTTASPSGTFTYTPASAGVKTISVTNGGGLSNPSNISFTASAASSKGGSILALLTGKVL